MIAIKILSFAQALPLTCLIGCCVDPDKGTRQVGAEHALSNAVVFPSRDPAAMATEAIKRGDYRLFAVAGFGVQVPGVDGKLKRPPLDADILVICNVGDFEVSDAMAAVLSAAKEYARAYNSIVKGHRRDLVAQ